LLELQPHWLNWSRLQGFDRLVTLPSLPLPSDIDADLVRSLLDLLHASPSNPLARQQRQPRPREPYRRPDGFVDDGTWRPPPCGPYGQRSGYLHGPQYQQPPRDGPRGGYAVGREGWQGYGQGTPAYSAAPTLHSATHPSYERQEPHQSFGATSWGGFAGPAQRSAPGGGHGQAGAGHAWGQGQRLGGNASGQQWNASQPGS
jgi:hypothetical protein